MVDFDIAHAKAAVEPSEVECADFALQGLPKPLCLSYLPGAELPVALSVERPAGKEATLDGGVPVLVEFVRILGQRVQLACAHGLAQGCGGLQHVGLPVHEGGDHLLVETAAFCGSAGVAGLVRGQIRGLTADAADGPELRNGLCCAFVDRQRPEQVGEIRHAGVALAEFLPVVLDHECAGEEQLITGPCRASRHEQYRMSVRCRVRAVRSVSIHARHWGAVALSVGSVTLCDGWWQSVPVGYVWKEGA
ncbi:hypothetical protein [Streptomyces sp. NPDC055140]